MSGSDPGDGRAPGLTPGEAFSMLGNETRVALLQTLWNVGRPITYSELKDHVGIRDSGRFNYHLDRLVGHFVDRVGGGYRLTVAGEQAVQAVNANMFTEDPSYWPSEVDVDLAALDDATMWTPTRHDPTVNIRRATRLAREAEEIRFLTAVALQSVSEALRERTVSGQQTATGVFTVDLYETIRAVPDLAELTGDALESGNAAFYRYDGPVPVCVALIDDRLALVVQSDDEGNVRGHVETENEAVRSWVASTIEEYRRRSEPLTAAAFAG